MDHADWGFLLGFLEDAMMKYSQRHLNQTGYYDNESNDLMSGVELLGLNTE